jgi:pilus assembly protein CpaB
VKSLTPARLTMLMLLVVGGLVAAYIAKSLFAVQPRPVTVERLNVPVPVSDIPAGRLLQASDLGEANVERRTLQPGELLSRELAIGRVVKVPLKAAIPIKTEHLYEVGVYPPLKVAEGMKAMAISVRSITDIVDGLIKPGEYVDLLFTPNDIQGDPRAGGGYTRVLLEGIRVIAINRQTQQGGLDGDRHTVTLELTDEETKIVTLAQKKGDLTLTFNPNGKSTAEPKTKLRNKDRATLEEILALDPLKFPDPPAPGKDPFVMTIYRGLGRSDVSFIDGRMVDAGGFGGGPGVWGGGGRGAGPGTWGGGYGFYPGNPAFGYGYGYGAMNVGGGATGGYQSIPSWLPYSTYPGWGGGFAPGGR